MVLSNPTVVFAKATIEDESSSDAFCERVLMLSMEFSPFDGR